MRQRRGGEFFALPTSKAMPIRVRRNRQIVRRSSSLRSGSFYSFPFGPPPIAISGTLAVVLPEFVVDVDGTAGSVGTLAATLPELAASFGMTATAGAALQATLPELQADMDGSVFIAGSLDADLPDMQASFGAQATGQGTLSALLPDMGFHADGSAVDSGILATTLPELQASIAGSVETQGATLSAALPELQVSFSATATAAGQMNAILPELMAGLNGDVASAPTASLSAVLPELTALFTAHAEAVGSLSAVLPELECDIGGQFETFEHGDLNIVLPMLIMGANSRRIRDMELQRKLSREFIASSPLHIALIPGVLEKLPSGGIEKKEGVARPVQMFRLIPMSHTEKPQQSSSASASADSGVQRRYDYTLLGESDCVMRENDHWETEDGQFLVIEALVSYNGYERKGLVISYGRNPFHAEP